MRSTINIEEKLVGAVGIEPTTFGLKGRCSTTELRPYMRLDSLMRVNILHGNKFADLGGIGMSRGNAPGIAPGVATAATTPAKLSPVDSPPLAMSECSEPAKGTARV